MKASLNVCVMLGATHETRHFTMCILLKRVRIALTMLARAPLLAVAHHAEEAADLGVRQPLHELAGVRRELLDRALLGNQIEMTGTGVFGRTSLFSGKRPFVR